MSQSRHNYRPHLRSVVSYPERGVGGNNKYRGNCSPKLIEDLIAYFNVQEICDYMCGSNTTRDAANTMGIRSNTYDLHSGFDLLQHDIPERPEMIFWHPPYHSIITYSDVMYSATEVQRLYGYDPKQSDLSRISGWESFIKALNFCMMKQFCALEKGGRIAALVGDIKKNGNLHSMIMELTKPGTLENVIIKTQHNCFSDNINYRGDFIPIVHEYLILLRKDTPLVYPILMTYRRKVDIRDMPGATWRDVVADALENFRGETDLTTIYERIRKYRRAQTQQHWKEKVRQTLQYYPDLFISTRRGFWALKRHIV